MRACAIAQLNGRNDGETSTVSLTVGLSLSQPKEGVGKEPMGREREIDDRASVTLAAWALHTFFSFPIAVHGAVTDTSKLFNLL